MVVCAGPCAVLVLWGAVKEERVDEGAEAAAAAASPALCVCVCVCVMLLGCCAAPPAVPPPRVRVLWNVKGTGTVRGRLSTFGTPHSPDECSTRRTTDGLLVGGGGGRGGGLHRRRDCGRCCSCSALLAVCRRGCAGRVSGVCERTGSTGRWTAQPDAPTGAEGGAAMQGRRQPCSATSASAHSPSTLEGLRQLRKEGGRLRAERRAPLHPPASRTPPSATADVGRAAMETADAERWR